MASTNRAADGGGQLSVWLTGQAPSRDQRRGRYTAEAMTHPGKMLPAIARYLVATYTAPGELVCDPMAGIGTTLVEAMWLGRDAVGVEYEPRWARLAAANIHHAQMQGAPGTAEVYTGDARQLPAILPPPARNRVTLVVTSPPYGPSTHGHVRTPGPRRGKVRKLNHRYGAGDNLAYADPGQLADGFTQILTGAAAILRPGGHVAVTARPYRHRGELVDIPGMVAAAGTNAGLEPDRGVRSTDRRRPRRQTRRPGIVLPAEERPRRGRARRPAMACAARRCDHPAPPRRPGRLRPTAACPPGNGWSGRGVPVPRSPLGPCRSAHGGSRAMIIEHPATVYATDRVQLLLGDTKAVLATLPDASVDVVCTSPPYYAARDYGTGAWSGGRPGCSHRQAPSLAETRRAGAPRGCPRCGAVWADQQYGLEPTLQDYVDNLRAVFDQARRVLHPQGTLWLNLGDGYASGELGRNDARRRYPSLAARQRPRADNQLPAASGLVRKNLLGVPWRVALALQADGWILRNAVVWAKKNPMPSPVTDRLSNTHEMIFLFSRSPRYYFDLDAIRVPHRIPNLCSYAGTRRPGGRNDTSGPGKYARAGRGVFNGRDYGSGVTRPGGHKAGHVNGKNPGDVWVLATANLRGNHFAAYPIAIPLRAIAAGCPPDGVVLDPFSGAATTGLAALQLGRRYLGIDLNPEYHTLAKERISRQMQQLVQSNQDSAGWTRGADKTGKPGRPARRGRADR